MITTSNHSNYTYTAATSSTTDDSNAASSVRRSRSLSDASASSESSSSSSSSRPNHRIHNLTFEKLYKIQDCQQISDLYRECVAKNFSDRKVCSTATSLYVACSYSDK